MTPRTYEAHTPLQALLIEQALLMAREIEQAAGDAPDGQVLARLEASAVPAARELARLAVQSAAQAQADEAEKRGRAGVSARPAPARRRTRGAPPARS